MVKGVRCPLCSRWRLQCSPAVCTAPYSTGQQANRLLATTSAQQRHSGCSCCLPLLFAWYDGPPQGGCAQHVQNKCMLSAVLTHTMCCVLQTLPRPGMTATTGRPPRWTCCACRRCPSASTTASLWRKPSSGGPWCWGQGGVGGVMGAGVIASLAVRMLSCQAPAVFNRLHGGGWTILQV